MQTNDGIPNAVDESKLAEIDNLLIGSDAGKIEYDNDGNAIFDENKAQSAYEKAIAGEKDANGLTAETPVDTEAQTQETVEKEAEPETEEPETDPESEEPQKAIPTWDDEVEIPMPDGRQSLTLGEMKDELVELARNKDRVDMQSQELATERLIVNEILANPHNVTQERIDQLKAMNQQQIDRDFRTINEMFPHWSQNAQQRQADFDRMMRTGKLLGATDGEMQAITKPWIINMLKTLSDYMAREDRGRNGMKTARQPQKADGRKKPPRTPNSRATSFSNALNAAQGNLEGTDWAALDKAIR